MLGRCLSCGAVAAWFLSWKRAFGVPKTPIFFRCAGELQRPLFITPMSTAKKPSYTCRQIHWILVPDRKKSCFIVFTLHQRFCVNCDLWLVRYHACDCESENTCGGKQLNLMRRAGCVFIGACFPHRLTPLRLGTPPSLGHRSPGRSHPRREIT